MDIILSKKSGFQLVANTSQYVLARDGFQPLLANQYITVAPPPATSYFLPYILMTDNYA